MSSCNRMLTGREITPQLQAPMYAMSDVVTVMQKKKLTGNWTRSFRSDMTFRSKPQQALLDVDYFFPKNFSRTESSFVCLHRNLKEFCTIESIKFLHIALILFFRPLRYNVAMHLNKSSKKAFDLETFWNFFVSGCGLQYLKLARQERKATYPNPRLGSIFVSLWKLHSGGQDGSR